MCWKYFGTINILHFSITLCCMIASPQYNAYIQILNCYFTLDMSYGHMSCTIITSMNCCDIHSSSYWYANNPFMFHLCVFLHFIVFIIPWQVTSLYYIAFQNYIIHLWLLSSDCGFLHVLHTQVDVPITKWFICNMGVYSLLDYTLRLVALVLQLYISGKPHISSIICNTLLHAPRSQVC